MKAILSVVLIAVLLFVSRADLPVHCVWPQVQGKWTFQLTSDGKSKEVVYGECSYTNPLPPAAKTVTINLAAPNIATDDQGNQGTFTLIYDQGFEIIIGGRRFFAFFMFEKDGSNVISRCDRTFTGWFHEDAVAPTNWGCFRGTHTNSTLASINKFTESAIPKDTEFRNSMSFVEKINKSQKFWEAAPYPEFEGMRMSRLLARGGRRTEKFRIEAQKKHMEAMRPHAQKALSFKANDFPTKFDWRDRNMVSPVRNQASCGSCYTFSSAGMFEARARVQTQGVWQPIFSTQDIVSCDPFNQGCEGGFTYSVSKYAHDFGVANETCDPYIGRDDKCKHTCPDSRAFVSDYKYIGGYYGATTEEAMMEAILNRGPISVDFYVYRDFFYYKGGVYVHSKVDEEIKDPRFEETNHAVLAVGWGVNDQGVKYWIVKNSWGAGWGMNGYFLIRKGTDECGIESSAVEAILKIDH